MAFSMNKKIAGMSVGAIVILAVVAFVVYWFAFRTEGFSSGNTVSFRVKNNSLGEITAQIYGSDNGQKAGLFSMPLNMPVTIRPNETKTVSGTFNRGDLLPYTLFLKSSVPHLYNVRIFGAKIRRLSTETHNTLLLGNGPLNQAMAWQKSRNKMPLSLRLPVPIHSGLGTTAGLPILQEGSNYVDIVDNGVYDSEIDAGRRLFIEKL